MRSLIYKLSTLIIGIFFSWNMSFGAIYARSLPVNCDNKSPDHAKFHHEFVNFMEKWQMLGAAVAVSKHDKIILSCGYGWSIY